MTELKILNRFSSTLQSNHFFAYGVDSDPMTSFGGRSAVTTNVDDDGDLAFNLQLEEALKASLLIQSKETLEIHREITDYEVAKSETQKIKEDLSRLIHDKRVALEIAGIPEDEWDDCGDWFARPYGEGSSKSRSNSTGLVDDEVFRVYFKGCVADAGNSDIQGIGVAICDSRDGLLFELNKPLVSRDKSRQGVEMRALIQGLNSALELGLKRVSFYCHYYPIFRYVTHQWTPKQKKLIALLDQVSVLQQKFSYCQPFLIAGKDVKYAFQLARDALAMNVSRAEESISLETCTICLEDRHVEQIFSIDICGHRYCFSCMKQHVEVKLLHGLLPSCPHEKCKTQLKIDSCSAFLTPKLIGIMSQRIKEASIPPTEKVYCPYPKCSTLMSKNEVLEYSRRDFIPERFGARKCVKCDALFCINCRVPWHINFSCAEYQRRNPHVQPEEAKLKSLAVTNMWRQCVKCSHMIELAAGCYHMTCRCGYQFCYTCGAEWRNGRGTCSCPLWDENNIIDTEPDEDEEDEDPMFDDDFDPLW